MPLASAELQGVGQGPVDHGCGRAGGDVPADDGAGEGVDHESGVDEPVADPDVGEVGDEQPVRGVDPELPVNVVLGASTAPGSGIVVRTRLVRRTPCQPFLRISRSTVQRATLMPWRCRCAHIFSDPYNDSGGRRPCSSGS